MLHSLHHEAHILGQPNQLGDGFILGRRLDIEVDLDAR